MQGAASIAAVLLAVVFGWAAIAKAINFRRVAGAFADLRLPAPSLLAFAVPVAEAATAVALVVAPIAGGAAALALLALFTVVVVRALAATPRAGCGCFGTARVEPVSPADVVRNGLLAAFAVVATGASRLTRPSLAAAAAMTLAIVVAVVALAAARARLGPA